jgi:hypothetical protein
MRSHGGLDEAWDLILLTLASHASVGKEEKLGWAQSTAYITGAREHDQRAVGYPVITRADRREKVRESEKEERRQTKEGEA